MRQTLRKLNNQAAAWVMTVLLLLSFAPTARAADASGTCGSGVEWSLSGGVLTISGSGSMTDYGELSPAPWQAYKDSILSVVVQEGVTGVGDFAFFKLDKLRAVRLADSVEAIGDWAFYYCSSLEIAELGGVKEIGQSAFERCLSLTGVRLPDSLQTLRYHAFYRCENLLSITIPASVIDMDTSVFAYCINLRSASVLANISELPLWTFYGCEALQSVSLTSNITTIGTQAFYHCDSLSQAVYGGPQHQIQNQMPQVDTFVAFLEPAADDLVEVSATVTETLEDGSVVTTDRHYTSSANSSVDTQIIQNVDSVAVKIDATLENADGWKDVADKLSIDSDSSDAVEVNVWLKGNPEISGADLGRFAGKDVELTIHTSQGAVWHVNGSQITGAGLSDGYDLSFTLTALTEPTDGQLAAVGAGKSFIVVFHEDIDFKVEVELPLGTALARDTAVFFAPDTEKDTYRRMQASVIDTQGIAHFYLGQVNADEEYLIGINVPDPEAAGDTVSDAIIPNTMQNEYPNMEQVEEIEYVVVGVKSSWGMSFKQVSGILFGVMGGCVIVVGVVVGIMYKQKVKRGYVPDMSYVDDDE